jgi:hypothetical protein
VPQVIPQDCGNSCYAAVVDAFAALVLQIKL